MKKRVLALLIAALLVFAVFAACGNDEGVVDPPVENGRDTPPPAPPAPPEPPDDEVTITVWTWDPAFNVLAMEEAAKIYAEINPNVTVEVVEIFWDDLQIQLTNIGTSGNLDLLPDIFLVQDGAFQLNVIDFPNLFLDLTDSAINFNEFSPAKAAMSTVDGRNFGVPFDNGTTITALRTDVLEEAGFTIDDFTDITWDEFIERGSVVLEETGLPLLSTTTGGGDLIAAMLQSAGSSMFAADGSANIAGNETIIEAITTYQALVASGVLVEVNNWDEFISSFVGGSVAGTLAGCWIIGSVQENAEAGHWGVANIPRLDIPGGTNYSNWGGSSWAVAASSPNADIAIDFLNQTFAGSTEFYDIILPAAGAIATWLPAANSPVYAEPHPFFGGQAVFADIVRWSGNVPQLATDNLFFYEARDVVNDAVNGIIVGGADITAALESAQQALEFIMAG